MDAISIRACACIGVCQHTEAIYGTCAPTGASSTRAMAPAAWRVRHSCSAGMVTT